jgi:hypothetical protein
VPVVDDVRTGGDRRSSHLGAPCVDTDDHVAGGDQFADHRDHPVELSIQRDGPRAGPRRFATDVDDQGTCSDHCSGLIDRGLR